MASTTPTIALRSPTPWYIPTWSHEHGVYIVLLVAFFTGAAAAQAWTWMTTLAFICAFCGFQAEHPLVLQIKQRRSWKPRFLVWGGVYASIALFIALYLYIQSGLNNSLLWIYGGAIAAFLIDAISVFYREQKSIWNEFLTFAAVCLIAPLTYAVTTGSMSTTVLGVWMLNTLFFASAIFTVKLRKPDKGELPLSPVKRVWAYHAISTLIVLTLWYLGWLPTVTALAFGIVVIKAGLILWQQNWYRTTKIQHIAILETASALSFGAIVCFSLLPAHL
jgi:hypothetical protein